MPRNGSGTFTLVAGNPVVTGTTISSTWANNTLSDIASALTASVAKDGQTPITANFNWQGFNITNVGTLSGTTLTASGTVTAANYIGSGTGGRFTADFVNATIASRFAFQCVTTNASTNIPAIPNGTASGSSWMAFNNSTPTDAAYAALMVDNVEARIRSGHTGAGTTLPLAFHVDSVTAGQINLDSTWTFATDTTFGARVFSPIGVAGIHKNLAASATGTNANVAVTADQVCLEGSSIALTVRTVSLTIDLSASGANGLDSGSSAASTWYSLWVIYNPTTSTIAGLASLSATAPTMPTDYTYKARVGWCRTDATANEYPLSFIQKGNRVQYKVTAATNLTALPIMASGAAGNIAVPTWVAVATGNYVPSTAGTIRVVAAGNGQLSMSIIVAPSNAYGAITSSTNPPPIVVASSASNNAVNIPGDMELETTNIYWAANNGNAALACLGWIDNI